MSQTSSPPDAPLLAAVAEAVTRFQADGDTGRLVGRLQALARGADPDALAAAAEPYRQLPEAAAVLYERLVAARPDDARALVALANAWWLLGRGPDVVGDLAERALAADPTSRAAWHLWALTEPSPRARTERWRQVAQRFPSDELAKASFADNAASLAGAEHDPVALKLAIAAYEELRATSTHPQQQAALDGAIRTLREWRL